MLIRALSGDANRIPIKSGRDGFVQHKYREDIYVF